MAILTSDNPRSEDPLAILAEMLHGVLGVPPGERARVIVEPDRAAAIDLAVGLAGKGDVVLVAGKGHETGQYVAGTVLPFDDREVTAEALGAAGSDPPPADPWAGTGDPADAGRDRRDHRPGRRQRRTRRPP